MPGGDRRRRRRQSDGSTLGHGGRGGGADDDTVRDRADGRDPGDGGEDERRLVDGLLAGRAAAVTEFLERAHHAVYGLSARLGGDHQTRRDWAHAALLGLLEDLRRGRFVYRGPGSFWAWFRKRAYYRVLDERRRGRLRAEREGSGPLDEHGEVDLDLYAAGEDPAREFERVEIRAAIEACLDALPSRHQRRVLRLLYGEDLPYQEIAALTETPLNTVRSWIRRGRVQLRRCLARKLGLGVPAGDGES